MDATNITGHLILLMAPSGSGKGMLMEALDGLEQELYFVKTYTSRPRREGATENPRYLFVSRDEFEELIKSDSLFEWANFSGNYYGTPKDDVLSALAAGKAAFKEMELQGVQQVRATLPPEAVTVIYVDAGGWESLKRRIKDRAQMSDEELEQRHQRFLIEDAAKAEADVIISNKDGELADAQAHFRSIISDILKHVHS